MNVLVVDDDPIVGQAIERMIRSAGDRCTVLDRASLAVAHLQGHPVDVVITDLSMPDIDGMAMLKTIRRQGIDLPVIVLTGEPSMETAIKAVELGVVRYLVKPVVATELVACVHRAAALGKLATVRREAAASDPSKSAAQAVRVSTEASLDRALETLWMAHQPIVQAGTGQVLAYESLMRSREPDLPSPPAVIHAAELVGRIDDVGRRTRELIARDLAALPPGVLSFVNIHATDLLDDALFDPRAPLSAFASRVVLELTERASVDTIGDVRERITRLRKLGYRIAIDDLGAGYAGLSYFAQLDPDFAKIDMSLVRGIDQSPTKTRVVLSLVGLCRDLGITVIAEGIETLAERKAILAVGADALQGYHFGRPGPPFPAHVW